MDDTDKRLAGAGGRLAQTLRPKDAATLIVVDASRGPPRVLMGRRRADLVFLPGQFVFPGGRVDRADRNARSIDELEPRTLELLMESMKGTRSPARARGLALCAIRETFEETGIAVGSRDAVCSQTGPWVNGAAAAEPAASAWRHLNDSGCVPALSGMRLLARAITPPGRPRRFDTRFFCVDATTTAASGRAGDGELESIDWFSLEEIRALPVPSITRAIIEDLADRLNERGLDEWRPTPVPFYFYSGGTFQRTLLGRSPSAS